MGRYFDALKSSVKVFKEDMGPKRYSIAGRPIRCTHCGEDAFAPGSALLNTVGLTLLNLDWANRSATILVCAECGRIEWYAEEPQEAIDETTV